MSRNVRNNVRGPTSALTEFLRESGITPTTIARRAATRGRPPPTDLTEAQADVTAAHQEDQGLVQQEEAPAEAEASSSRPRTRASADGYASDELDEREEESPAAKKRTGSKSKATVEKEKAKAKAKAKKGKKKGDDDDGDYEDEDEDAYTALSKMWAPNATKPPIGSFEECAKCEKQFTVTKYTMAANPPPGFLCHPCAKSSGTDPFKKPAAPRRTKTNPDKRKVVYFEAKSFPTLVSLCIELITRHIDDVEALGDLGSVNMEEIARALSKNRKLTPDNAPLFYDVQAKDLTFYDATLLTSPALCTLALLNPNLTSLRLDFCGRIDDAVMNSWAACLPHLVHLDLFGPFLVRPAAWLAFITAHPALESFLITQSPRFDLACVQALTRSCTGLHALRLREAGQLRDSWLDEICSLAGTLEYLDLAEPGRQDTVSEDALVGLLQALGPWLEYLDLSGHARITDEFLEDGLHAHARVLTSLKLANAPLLTDNGVADFFNFWTEEFKEDEYDEEGDERMEEVEPPAPRGDWRPNPALCVLDLSRNQQLGTAALDAVLAHSGVGLVELNINGWKAVGREVLESLGRKAPFLQKVDLGFCREVNDFVVKDVLEGCAEVKEVSVWGCNQVTESCPKKRGVTVMGVESDLLV